MRTSTEHTVRQAHTPGADLEAFGSAGGDAEVGDTVTAPGESPDAGREVTRTTAALPTGPDDPDSGRVVLLVEDSDADHEAVERVLTRHRPDLTLEWCATGEDARRRLSAPDGVPPGLIFLDLNMSDVDGRDVLLTLKGFSHLRRVPVVVLTTSARPEDVEACYALGAKGYVFKPVNFAQLESAVRGAVDYWLPIPG